jgi:hypothetical protein
MCWTQPLYPSPKRGNDRERYGPAGDATRFAWHHQRTAASDRRTTLNRADFGRGSDMHRSTRFIAVWTAPEPLSVRSRFEIATRWPRPQHPAAGATARPGGHAWTIPLGNTSSMACASVPRTSADSGCWKTPMSAASHQPACAGRTACRCTSRATSTMSSSACPTPGTATIRPALPTRRSPRNRGLARCLGLRDLVHLLLQRAGFNRWYPRMEGKRTWYVVRKRLMLAAREIETKGVRLAATCGPGGRPPPSCGCGTRCVGRRGQRG